MNTLPEEVLEIVFTFLSPYTSLPACRLVCRRWHAIVRRVCLRLHSDLLACCRQLRLEWFHYEYGLNSVRATSPASARSVNGGVPSPAAANGGKSPNGQFTGNYTGVSGISAAKSSVTSGQLRRPSTGTNRPAPLITRRCAHAAVFVDRLLYVFGGCSYRMTTFNDLWTLEPATLQWNRPRAVGAYPSPKAYMAMAVWFRKRRLFEPSVDKQCEAEGHGVSDPCLVVFGGWSRPAASLPLHALHQLYDELHVYDVSAASWTRITLPTTAAAGTGEQPLWPPATAAHGCSVVGDWLVVTGGLQQQAPGQSISVSNAVWAFHLVDHYWLHPECDAPPAARSRSRNRSGFPARYGHSQLTLDDRHVLVLGGTAGRSVLFRDAWLLEVLAESGEAVWRWHRLHVQCANGGAGGGGGLAPAVWCHQACRLGDSVLVLAHRSGSLIPSVNSEPVSPEDRVDRPRPLPVPSPPRSPRAVGILADIQPPPQPDYRSQRCQQQGDRVSSERDGPGPGPGPSVRPNARASHRRRHEALDRLQARLARLTAPVRQQRCRSPVSAHYRLVASSSGECGNQRRASDNMVDSNALPASRVRLHVLDVSNAVARHRVTWRGTAEAPSGALLSAARAPERVLYTLTAARGELLLFGGVSMTQYLFSSVAVSSGYVDPDSAEDTTTNTISVLSVPADLNL